MKIAIFSDIHGNYTALEVCIQKIEKMNVDTIIWCGDYITDFPESHKVIQLIKQCEKKYKCYIISGNREQYIIKFDKIKNINEINIKMKNNIICTYNSLTKEDLEWIKSLPLALEISIDGKNKIYVSHKCDYRQIENCKYKIFGHSHKQYNFRRDDVKYINPGSVGISTDKGVIGAQFSILEITDTFEKIEEYIIKYDINEVIKKIKNSKIYTDEIQWGKLLEKEIETGIDIPQQCLDEYNQIVKEHNIENDSIEVWEEAMKNVFTKFTM